MRGFLRSPRTVFLILKLFHEPWFFCDPSATGDGRGLCDGPSVVAEHDRWTVFSSKVNLPAALNDPRLAKRESDFFTKTWGLDFAETEVMPSFCLPNVAREHFGPYLQEMAQVAHTDTHTYTHWVATS